MGRKPLLLALLKLTRQAKDANSLVLENLKLVGFKTNSPQFVVELRYLNQRAGFSSKFIS